MKTDAKREIIGLALLLDEISDLLVFVSYSGHVKSLKVRVFSIPDDYDDNSDWNDSKTELFSGDFYTHFEYSGDEKSYLEIKHFLQTEIDKRIAV